MWALYTRTIKDHRLSWTVYSAVALLFLGLYISVYPSMQAQAATYDQIIASMPKAVLDAFGITQSVPTLMGFLASKHFGFVWPLMAIMLTVAFAGSALSRGVEQRTVGLLLSLPVSRLHIYWARVLAGLTGLILFTLASIVVVWPLAVQCNYELDAMQVWDMSVLGIVFGAAVLGISMLLAAWIDESGKLYGAAGGVLLAMYVGNLIAGLEPDFDVVKYASVFHYFMPGDVVSGSGLDMIAVTVLGGVTAATLLVGSLIAKRRDLSV